MRKILFVNFILYLFLGNKAICQSDKTKSVFKNETFKFNILKTSTKILDSNKIDLSMSLVKSILSGSDKKRAGKLRNSDWIKLLTDEKTDWATNLYLYDINRKEASVFEVINTDVNWRKCCKEKDVAFWKDKFSHSQ